MHEDRIYATYNPYYPHRIYEDQLELYRQMLKNDNVKESEDKGTEEWVWVTGYKGTDKDMKCRDYQYEMGKQHDMPEGSEIDICWSGFHFCDKLDDVFRYYGIGDGHRFFEVKALVRRWNKNGTYIIEHRDDKMAAKSIQFVRELTIEKIWEHVNDKETANWTLVQKAAALQTSIRDVKRTILVNNLIDLGYSEAFASFVCREGEYDLACTMASMPNVSMDVKVLTICMSIYD